MDCKCSFILFHNKSYKFHLFFVCKTDTALPQTEYIHRPSKKSLMIIIQLYVYCGNVNWSFFDLNQLCHNYLPSTIFPGTSSIKHVFEIKIHSLYSNISTNKNKTGYTGGHGRVHLLLRELWASDFELCVLHLDSLHEMRQTQSLYCHV